ncbi:alpha/beta hydrolase [Bacillus sp. T3]|uniref:alpha/beta fold hydrolase n=1 Tax=Bacillus sp. T3 TaxID=467262 RepID=UPI00298150E0|nr:alpha/beta hydrolase [Bacillus sp. T3]
MFDIRGHGNSAISDYPLTYALICDDIVHLLDKLKIEKAFICGYSTGGSIVLNFLLSYPERAIGGILISSMSEVNDWLLRKEIALAAFLSKKKWMKALVTSVCYGNSDTKETFTELYNEAKKGNAKNIQQYYQHSLTYCCTSQLPRIKHPVLLLYGENNKQFQPHAQLISKSLRNNELIFIKNGKHQLPTKSASEVNRVIKEFALKYT